VGSYGEADAVRARLAKLKSAKPVQYGSAAIKRMPDLFIPTTVGILLLDPHATVLARRIAFS
jgi:hypothetical protein